MDASSSSLRRSAYLVRMGIVAALSLATALVVGTRADLDSRPALVPLVLAGAAAFVLWAIDRRADSLHGREIEIGARWMRLGFYLMAGSTVLGVANTWYAFLDPARNGWFSALFLIGSVLAATAFFWLDSSRRAPRG